MVRVVVVADDTIAIAVWNAAISASGVSIVDHPITIIVDVVADFVCSRGRCAVYKRSCFATLLSYAASRGANARDVLINVLITVVVDVVANLSRHGWRRTVDIRPRYANLDAVAAG